MEASPPPKSSSSSTTTSIAPSPPTPTPSPTLLHSLVTLDTSLSQRLHILAKPFLPHLILLILELSADFRLFFPLSLSLLFAPTLTPTTIPGPSPSPSAIQILRPLFSPLILGLLLDLALIGLIKILFRRPRPVYNKNMNVAVSVDHFSFPSGHASRVCFVAALLHLSAAALVDAVAHLRSTSPYLDRWIVADQAKAVSVLVSVAWTWAAATSFSRILLGRHFVTDVFAGACLGVLEGVVAFQFLSF